MNKKNQPTLPDNTSIRDAVKTMDLNELKSIIIINSKKKVIGVFTMGDFRRAIFFGLDINDRISTIINKNFYYLREDFSKKNAIKIFNDNKSIFDIPILDKNFRLLNILSRNNFKSLRPINIKNTFLNKYPVVIMAGGKGTRLDPFTRILPKPLMPFGNNPIIRVIMENFKKFGSTKFYVSINEKSNMIKTYFNDFKSTYRISYIEEKRSLGTVGSIELLKGKLKSTFFLTNCDILIQSDYSSMIDFHTQNNNDITLISSMRNYTIPYGVCDFNENGELKSIKEKPQYDFFVNTGLYIMEPKILKFIKKNEKLDMNILINRVKDNGLKIGVFPLSEKSWLDIGQWSEYKKSIDSIKYL